MPSLFGSGSNLFSQRQLGSLSSLTSLSQPASFDAGMTSTLLDPTQPQIGGISKLSGSSLNPGEVDPLTGSFGSSTSKLKGADIGKYGGGSNVAPMSGQSGSIMGGAGNVGGDWSGVERWSDAINQAAAQYGVPANLIKSIMKVESNGDPNAVGADGVWGPMQVHSGVWGYGPWSYDPVANIMKGAEILSINYKQYGSWDMAIQAYLGFGTDMYGTTNYTYRDAVMNNWNALNNATGGAGMGWTPTNTIPNVGDPSGNRVLQEAVKYVGVRYTWGGIPGRGQDPWAGGWDCCLVPETRIYGPMLAKRIDEIQEGDVVWSFQDGKMVASPVTKVWQSKTQPVYRVRARGRSVIASGNHPFLVLRTKQRGPQAHVEQEWVRADQLKRGDYLVSFERGGYGHKEPAEDMAWLMGLILGDGNINGRHLNLCVYGENRERALSILRHTTQRTPLSDNKHGIVVSAREFCDHLVSLGFDKPAHQKRIPSAVWEWAEYAKRAFLDGYCAADGHKPRLKKHGERSYASSSPDLINDVRAMHLSLGDAVGNVSVNRRAKPIVIKGKTILDAKPLYSFAVYERGVRYNGWANTAAIRNYVADGDGRWMVRPVLDVEPMAERETWDMEVAGTGNFVADGIVVHNSGFTYWLDQNYGSGNLPMGSHYQYQYAQQNGLLNWNPGALQPGDLVFFDTGWQGGAGAELNRAGHVGVYLGNDQFIHAANEKDGTIISQFSTYNGGQFIGGMRSAFSGGGAVGGGFGGTGGGFGGFTSGGGGRPSWDPYSLLQRLRG